MADLRVSQQYTLCLQPDEFRLLSKALRCGLDTEAEIAEALALQERLMLSRAQQAATIAEEAAKTVTNINRSKNPTR